MNAFRDTWLQAIGNDDVISAESQRVAAALSRSVGIGRISFTNWQRLNGSLGRQRADGNVLVSIRELQGAGYLGRFQGNRYDQSRGWSLLLPGEEVQ